MGGNISIDQMAEAVNAALEEYNGVAFDSLKSAIDEGKKAALKDIQSKAPQRTGKYAKSWKAKKMSETTTRYEVTLYSPSRYMLAHLLEHGHANRGGGRTPGRAHLAPAEQHAIEVIEDKLEENLRRG